MCAIINGRTYNTDTGLEICDLPCDAYSSDFSHHSTTLCRTKKGTFFLAGRGGPMSLWAEREGNVWSGSSGIKVVSVAAARCHMESANCKAKDFEECGLTLEEG